MATKTQKEFKRQMKELEKDGKLPQGYYARRRITYTSGASVLLVLYILWRLGVFGMIFSFVFMLFNPGYANPDLPSRQALDLSNPEAAAVSAYYDAASAVETFISDVYLDVYKCFYDKKQMDDEVFADYKDKLGSVYEGAVTELAALKELSQNYKEDLDVTSDMLDFALEHRQELAEQDRRYLEILTKKSRELSNKRSSLWLDVWERYEY